MKDGRGLKGIEFIELVEFVAFTGLMKRKRVEDAIPTDLSNTINPKNAMNKATKIVGFKGLRVIQGLESSCTAISRQRHSSFQAS